MFSNLLKKKFEKHWLLLKFLLTFGLFSIPLYMVLYSPINFMPLQSSIANQVGKLLKISGVETLVEKNVITFKVGTNSFTKVVIVRECTGWMSFLAFFGLVTATPKIKLKDKIKGLATGMPIIYTLNIVRLFLTFYIVHEKGLGWFETIHSILWRISLILFIFGLWVVWFKFSKE